MKPRPRSSRKPAGNDRSRSRPVPASKSVPATEVEASLLPLGASIGTAGLAVMPYSLSFNGNFFGIAKFIGKVDALVESGKAGKMTSTGAWSRSAASRSPPRRNRSRRKAGGGSRPTFRPPSRSPPT